jgi:hypothetical protein
MGGLAGLIPSLLRAPLRAVGWLICRSTFLDKRKAEFLSMWSHQGDLHGLDAILFRATMGFWYRNEYLREPDPDRREAMKATIMGGEAARAWAIHYQRQPVDLDRRVGDLSLGEALPALPELDRLLAVSAEPTTIVQIGASSGRETAWLARRHPRHHFIGTDAFAEAVDYASHYHEGLGNLRFEVCAAADIARPLGGTHGHVVLFSSGALTYVQPEHVARFFGDAAARGDVVAVIMEPSVESYDCDPRSLAGSRWGEGFMAIHDYRHYAERAGFRTTRCEIIRPYAKGTDRASSVHYLYWGVVEAAVGSPKHRRPAPTGLPLPQVAPGR